MVYEIRKLRKAGKLHKYFVDENGQISVRISETDGKRRVSYFSVDRGSDPVTLNIQELQQLINAEFQICDLCPKAFCLGYMYQFGIFLNVISL